MICIGIGGVSIIGNPIPIRAMDKVMHGQCKHNTSKLPFKQVMGRAIFVILPSSIVTKH